ncbi:hypothetical protein B0H14DRAFT_3490747 [Mycena olivaceomarginata]|nr:hypothetical protein B0H14DRAFT_3490747 [Mycena olivaceomarginata]
MARLPQELFDAIIDEIHDKETLKACALVGSSFLPPSQRKLFRKVRLGRRSRDREAALAESPHLASYVRHLTIVMPSTVPDSVAVAGVLRSVQNIESLVVSGMAPGVNWNSVEHEARSTLLECLSRPSLRSLLLSGMDVSAALISAATAIPVVSFFDIPPRLRHLTLVDTGPAVPLIYDFLLHPRNPAYTQQIERLRICIDQDNASYAGRIIAACAATLKYLAINLEDITRLPLLPFVLEVEITVWVRYDRRLPAFFSQNISQIASSLPLAETITLVVFVKPIHPGPEIQWGDEAPLPIFGPSFMDRAQLLHLRRVHCILRRQGPFDDISALFDRFVLAMESMMPGLQATIFSFKLAQLYTSDAQFRKHSIIGQRLSGLSFAL